uniref:Potassium/proton antiporter CemA n=1 Tax=Microglena monadina TaxID=47904 RepID=A0A0S2IAU9_9CHLO|nr:chloroplast enveloppe membrane protein [Microglena monadina]
MNNVNPSKNKLKNKISSKQEVVSVIYEEIGLFPRSFSRVTDRFLQQIFSDVENLIIHEYRFYRYLFFTTFKTLLILFFVPILVNSFAKDYLVRPLTEYLWNSKQTEIFLNKYQQKKAFLELNDFEKKLYFESLILSKDNESIINQVNNSKTNENSESLNIKKESNNDLILDNELINLNFYAIKKDHNIQSEIFNYSIFSKSNLIKNVNEKSVYLNFLENQNSNQESNYLQKKKFLKKIEIRPPKLNQNKNTKILNIKKKILTSTVSDINKKFIPKFVQESFSFEPLINIPLPNGKIYIRLIDKTLIEKNKPTVLKLHEKTIELAIRYNKLSIEALTNIFSDLISFLTLCYLLFSLEIQVNITKSFLLELFFGFEDSKKSLLILLVTDLLVGYHSSNIWESFFEFVFDHYGLAESQTGVYLLVATLPVLLDVLFKYLIFRHLNRSSPATVATYRAMIE